MTWLKDLGMHHFHYSKTTTPDEKGSIKPHDFSPQHFFLGKKLPKPTCNDSFLEKTCVIYIKGDETLRPFSEFGDKRKGRSLLHSVDFYGRCIGKYTIHGSYGNRIIYCVNQPPNKPCP